jgi:hypothetical protein
MNFRILLLAPLAALMLSAGAADLRMPQGWRTSQIAYSADRKMSGEILKGYEVGLDPAAGGLPTLTVRSVFAQKPGPISTGSAYQWLYGYGGKRVRFSGELKAEGVRGWAGLYLHDGPNGLDGAVLNAKSGTSPLPTGTAVQADRGWHPVNVVLDVPAETTMLGMGLGLVGEGQVWARNLRFEIVGPEVAPTRTLIGVDLAADRRFFEYALAETAKEPPAPLKNAALD